MTDFLLKLFVKNRENTEDPGVRGAYGRLAGLTGIVCNLLLFAGKLIVGLLSGSVSISADAVNNLTDASSSVVTLVGFRMAGKPADKDHPYGHARVEYISALGVAAIVLLIGYELAKSSVQKILHPEQVTVTWITAAVLVVSIAVKLWLSRFNKKLGTAIHSSALLATATDSRNDVISTAAVLLSCAIGAFTKLNPDGYMGLLVALFILYSGFGIARDTIDPLLGAAPDDEFVRRIADKLRAQESVLGIHDLMVHDYGPGRRFASVHVEMDRKLDPLLSHDLIDRMERNFLQEENLQLVIHYDPVVTDDEEAAAAKALVEAVVGGIDQRLTIHDFRMVAGPLHTNVIFDLVVPFEREKDAQVLISAISASLQAVNPSYHAVICVDSDAFNPIL